MSKHAYLIIAYHQWELLKTLIQLIDDERNDIFIHIDKKITDVPADEISSAAKKSEVIFTERLPIYRGTYVISKAELLLLKTALNHGEYRYFHLISGQDLPLKTQNELHSFFDEMDGYNFIDLVQPNQLKKRVRESVTLYNLFIKKSFAKKTFVASLMRNTNRITKELQRLFNINRFAIYEKEGYQVAYGSSWFSITDDFAVYLVNHEKLVEQMFGKMTSIAEEKFIQTLIWNSQYRDSLFQLSDDYMNVKPNLRYIVWTGNISPETIRSEMFDDMIKSPALFARKFDLNIDAKVVEQVKKHILKKD